MDERKEFEEWLRDYDPDASTTHRQRIDAAMRKESRQ